MLVRAKRLGYYRDRLIKPGTTFELAPGDQPGRWMEVLQAPQAPSKRRSRRK